MLPHAMPLASCWKSSCTRRLGPGLLGLDRRDELVLAVLDAHEDRGLDGVPRRVERDAPGDARVVLRRRDPVAELLARRLLRVVPRPEEGPERGRVLGAEPVERGAEDAGRV